MKNVYCRRMSEVSKLAWQLVKRCGFTLSEAMRTAWLNIKVKAAMKLGIVKFWFTKVDGSLREAYGTLKEGMMPTTQNSGRKANDTVQVYYDTEKEEFRCFKRANLVKMA